MQLRNLSTFQYIGFLQLLLFISLLVPGLLNSPVDSALYSTTQEVLEATEAASLQELKDHRDGTSLSEYLSQRFDDRSFHLTLRDPEGTVVLEFQPEASASDEDAPLREAFDALYRGFRPSGPAPLSFDSGSLRGWQLTVEPATHFERRHRPLSIRLSFESIVSSLFVLIMLSFAASRYLMRPIEDLRDELDALRLRKKAHISSTESFPVDLRPFIASLDALVREERDALSSASYGQAVLKQTIDAVQYPIFIIDTQRSLITSNALGRAKYGLGTHPNRWTSLTALHDAAFETSLSEAANHKRRIEFQPAWSDGPVSIEPLIRGNDTPWLLITEVGARQSAPQCVDETVLGPLPHEPKTMPIDVCAPASKE